jgi:superfamily I DNA/RNA helicase
VNAPSRGSSSRTDSCSRYEPIEPASDAVQKFAGPAIEAILIEDASAERVARDGGGRDRRLDPGPPRDSYREIAILLRSLVTSATYLEALRARGIPYVVEGEKYFYNTTEVVDFVNLLRAVANPHDRIAVAGVLRSPYGARRTRRSTSGASRSTTGADRRGRSSASSKRWNEQAGRSGWPS